MPGDVQMPLYLAVLGFLMFGLWTLAYLAIIIKAFKDKAYGIPIVDGCLNVSWEFMFSFNLVGRLSSSLDWGNRFWLVFDAVQVTTVFLYGRDLQTVPWVRRHFYWIVSLSLVGSFLGVYGFMWYFGDVYGVASSLLMDVLMAVLFIGLFFARPDSRGLSYAGAWLMMLGNIAGFLFIHFWYPTQFVNGVVPAYPWVHEPRSFLFLDLLYGMTTVLNALYVYLLWDRRRQVRQAAIEISPSLSAGTAPTRPAVRSGF